MIDLEEARRSLGKGVVYRHDGKVEGGVITGASSCYVFVTFDGDRGSKACGPDVLDWEAP